MERKGELPKICKGYEDCLPLILFCTEKLPPPPRTSSALWAALLPFIRLTGMEFIIRVYTELVRKVYRFKGSLARPAASPRGGSAPARAASQSAAFV